MTQQRRAGTQLIRLGHSGFVAAVPEVDLRGRGVYDPEGQRMGDVEELYIDRQQREVRFVEVGVGGSGDRREALPGPGGGRCGGC